MTEIDALLKIANAIQNVANALTGIGLLFWLMLIFKDMNGGSAIRDLAKVIKERI